MTEKNIKALYINCSLKPSSKESHTDLLIKKSSAILEAQGIKTEILRAADYNIAYGVQPDMREEGAKQDDWPKIWEKVSAADIVVIGSPIWIGNASSLCIKVLERLYAHSSQTNEAGQYIFYNKVGAALVTGNEDGGKHVSRDILYGLQHVGFTIPPQADAYWVGEAGPGPSYGDKDENGNAAGINSDFTNRMVRIMSWNLIHFANMLRKHGGIPVKGNTAEE